MMSAEELYQSLRSGESDTLLRRYLTPEMVCQLKDRKTYVGGSLADVIRAGSVALQTGTGIRVCDAEAYDVFSELLHPIIQDYHKIENTTQQLHDLSVNNLHCEVPFLDSEYIISTRVRTARSLKGFRFYPTLSSKERASVEHTIVSALEKLSGELAGTYYPLSSLSEETIQGLRKSHYLYSMNRSMAKSGGYENWPHNRGIYMNADRTFLVWVNEEDHVRIISMQAGGDLAQVFTRFAKAVRALDELLSFAKHQRWGYLNTCPSNIGTGIRASVHVKLPRLSGRPDFQAKLRHLNLEARGVDGDGQIDHDSTVYDISNSRRFGLTELEAVTEMAMGVKSLISQEQGLEHE